MKHIVMSGRWVYDEDPFPAFRVKLILGKNKRDRKSLPVKGVVPDAEGILPEGGFRIVKTKEKGTILVVSGEDKSNRCLLFVGCKGGFRGGVGLLDEGTTGEIIMICHAGNKCESAIEVVAILKKGEAVAFHASGRSMDEVHVYVWNGQEVEIKYYPKPEWEKRNTVVFSELPDNYEIL